MPPPTNFSGLGVGGGGVKCVSVCLASELIATFRVTPAQLILGRVFRDPWLCEAKDGSLGLFGCFCVEWSEGHKREKVSQLKKFTSAKFE